MESKAASDQLAALAQETRLGIFRLLVRQGAVGLAAGAIADQLDLPAPTLSFHLAQLKSAGLIDCRRESRSLIYVANFPAMNALLAYLTENCCAADGASCAPAVCAPRSQTKPVKLKRRA